MNFLQCYSLWRTLFELNHRECRVDFQIDTSTPDWHLKCQRQDCLHSFRTQWSNTNVSGETDNLSVIQDDLSIIQDIRKLLFEKSAHGRNFSTHWQPPGLWPRRIERVFDIPIAEMDEPIWQTKLPPQLSDWCILARCTNYQFSTIMWEKLRRPTTHSRTSQVAHRIVCSPMLMIGWTNHFLWPVSECRTFWGAKLRRSTHWQKISVNLSPISSFMRTWYPQKIRHLGTKCCTKCT